ncbi:unnamed protein product [Spirodela intermedia]|uniref:Uncharacterized protein n=2 Tax=Spirodela intermedia TaxID=51605 RepID=A0ABN7E830_SPIIN|nr:unnamed protein product [Spirodela intermedia]CAA6671816.1 unnamed protein product [Spirodela intermedia]CAA6673890.1 unnamed protein product [Spirodela intermedia]CAA7408943.1 unnamed protein product [Spirodela intermedia]
MHNFFSHCFWRQLVFICHTKSSSC